MTFQKDQNRMINFKFIPKKDQKYLLLGKKMSFVHL